MPITILESAILNVGHLYTPETPISKKSTTDPKNILSKRFPKAPPIWRLIAVITNGRSVSNSFKK